MVRIEDNGEPMISVAWNDSEPVPGLPKNFYDEEWLREYEARDKFAYKKLNIRKAVDVGFSDKINR